MARRNLWVVGTFSIHTRQLALLFLALAFLGQSYLIYNDHTGSTLGKLSPAAREGKKLWQNRNCQACHQMFGLGGVLGPDLTNVARRHSPQSLRAYLAAGPLQMPAFKISAEEAAHLYQFLTEMDQTGLSTRTPSSLAGNNKSYPDFVKRNAWLLPE